MYLFIMYHYNCSINQDILDSGNYISDTKNSMSLNNIHFCTTKTSLFWLKISLVITQKISNSFFYFWKTKNFAIWLNTTNFNITVFMFFFRQPKITIHLPSWREGEANYNPWLAKICFVETNYGTWLYDLFQIP